MTVIAAWKDKKEVWIAGDSGAFDDSTVIISAEPKIWKTETSLVGVSGSFRIMDILRNSKISDPYKIRDFLMSKSNEVGFPDDWAVLIANKTGIYEIGSDFGVVKSSENYGATGAGAQAALAALFVLENTENTITPRKRVESAVQSAIMHTTNARPPVKVLSL
jgi:ATP-dependent protease HslVU (ClpYQ) peptidase subunit